MAGGADEFPLPKLGMNTTEITVSQGEAGFPGSFLPYKGVGDNGIWHDCPKKGSSSSGRLIGQGSLLP